MPHRAGSFVLAAEAPKSSFRRKAYKPEVFGFNCDKKQEPSLAKCPLEHSQHRRINLLCFRKENMSVKVQNKPPSFFGKLRKICKFRR